MARDRGSRLDPAGPPQPLRRDGPAGWRRGSQEQRRQERQSAERNHATGRASIAPAHVQTGRPKCGHHPSPPPHHRPAGSPTPCPLDALIVVRQDRAGNPQMRGKWGTVADAGGRR